MPADVFWAKAYREVGDILTEHVDLDPTEDCEADAVSWLDRLEQERWQRCRHARTRREFALCRAALRSLLCRHFGCRNERLAFAATRHGKPFALLNGKSTVVNFNVSHSGRHGIIGIAPCARLGVDVEQIPPRRLDLEGIGDVVFGANEKADLLRASGDEKTRFFFKLWTCKEALIKALGTGFSLNPSEFEIPWAMRNGAKHGEFQFPHLPEVMWRLDDLSNTEFAAAIAHELNPRAIGFSCDKLED